MTHSCMYDGADCGCTATCPFYFLGDGHCDAECNNATCDYDLGDCGDAPTAEQFCNNGKCNMSQNLWDDVCQCDCDTPDCFWDSGSCKNTECIDCREGEVHHIGTNGLYCVERCGDGIVYNPNQICDDGNSVSGDGCENNCNFTENWICWGSPSDCDPCDKGKVAVYSFNQLGYCEEKCGDGWILTKDIDDQACDDGNTDNNDGCSSNCRVEDGWVCEGEPSVCEVPI